MSNQTELRIDIYIEYADFYGKVTDKYSLNPISDTPENPSISEQERYPF